MRRPGEVAQAWLLSKLDGGGWMEAEALEAAREAAGVSARALITARGRLVGEGRVEKRKAGRGAWSYRLVGRAPGPGPPPCAARSRRGSRRPRASWPVRRWRRRSSPSCGWRWR